MREPRRRFYRRRRCGEAQAGCPPLPAKEELQSLCCARLAEVVTKCAGLAPAEVVARCICDLENYASSGPMFDDQTLMVVQKSI